MKAVLSEESSGSLTMKDIRSKVISKLSVEDRENRIRVQALIDSTVALYQRRETKQESPDHKKVMKPIFKKWLGPSWKMTWVSKGFHLWQINMPCQTNIMPCQNAKQTWCEANMSCQHVKPKWTWHRKATTHIATLKHFWLYCICSVFGWLWLWVRTLLRRWTTNPTWRSLAVKGFA